MAVLGLTIVAMCSYLCIAASKAQEVFVSCGAVCVLCIAGWALHDRIFQKYHYHHNDRQTIK